MFFCRLASCPATSCNLIIRRKTVKTRYKLFTFLPDFFRAEKRGKRQAESFLFPFADKKSRRGISTVSSTFVLDIKKGCPLHIRPAWDRLLNVMSKQIVQEKSPTNDGNGHTDDAAAHPLGEQTHKAYTEKHTRYQKIGNTDPKHIPRQARKIHVTQK